jgi:hypothetical protein
MAIPGALRGLCRKAHGFARCGVFAEFERGVIRERVNVGLARAKARGVTLGRRRAKASVEHRIRELRAEGMGILKIGRTLGVGGCAARYFTNRKARRPMSVAKYVSPCRGFARRVRPRSVSTIRCKSSGAGGNGASSILLAIDRVETRHLIWSRVDWGARARTLVSAGPAIARTGVDPKRTQEALKINCCTQSKIAQA